VTAQTAFLGCVLVGVVAIGQSPSRARPQKPETVTSAALNDQGYLRIVTSGNRTVIIKKGKDHSSFDPPQISQDRTAVVSLANIKWGSPEEVAVELVSFANGHEHRFKGNETLIWMWHFEDAGTHVAFEQETRAFVCDLHYELVNVRSGAVIETFDQPVACSSDLDPPERKAPKWVADLNRELGR